MDGRGRCIDNVFVERVWRSLKYEEVFLHAYDGVPEARASIGPLSRLLQQRAVVNGRGDTPNMHDILTGSQPDGKAFPPDKDMTL